MSSPDGSTETPQPPPPANPAVALYQILKVVVIDNETVSIDKGWNAALGARLNSQEFVRRHCETVTLLDTVRTYLQVAPQFHRDVYSQYVPAWFTAVVCQSSWQSVKGANLLSTEVLNLLGGLGAALPDYSRNWDDTAQGQLTDAVNEWAALLDGGELSDDVATSIRGRLDQLIWLRQNVDLFGVQPIVDATSQVVSAGVQGMARSKPGVVKRIGIAIAASFVFLGHVHTTVDDAMWAVEGGKAIYEQMVELSGGNTAPQLSPPPRQLEPGESAASSGSRLDGGDSG